MTNLVAITFFVAPMENRFIQARAEGANGEDAIHNVDLVARVKGKALEDNYNNGPEYDGLNQSNFCEELNADEIWKFKEIGNKLLDQLRDAKDSQDQDCIHKTQDKITKYRSNLLAEYGLKTWVSHDETRISFKSLHRSSKEIEKVAHAPPFKSCCILSCYRTFLVRTWGSY